MTVDLSVYLVTDSAGAERAGHDLFDVLRAAAPGVSAVQLREKDATARRFLDTVLQSSAALPRDVAIIVNDRVDVFLAARAAGARVSGVHVGQSDLPADAVRGLIGPDAILGVSASTPRELALAAESGAVDYVGIGKFADYK
ncbi:MAG: thiamine phosphate synthase, partial [Actinobacteria bacterium]|nr:thiamine phosphate synthase [Actinomycetota bacterium]